MHAIINAIRIVIIMYNILYYIKTLIQVGVGSMHIATTSASTKVPQKSVLDYSCLLLSITTGLTPTYSDSSKESELSCLNYKHYIAVSAKSLRS